MAEPAASPQSCSILSFLQASPAPHLKEMLEAQQSYDAARAKSSQMSFHNAGARCEHLRVIGLAMRCYYSAIEAYYMSPTPNHRLFFEDCFCLGNIHFQAQQWEEATKVYSKIMNPKYYDLLEKGQKRWFKTMQKNFNTAFQNFVLAKRPDLLESKDGSSPKVNVDVITPMGRALYTIFEKNAHRTRAS